MCEYFSLWQTSLIECAMKVKKWEEQDVPLVSAPLADSDLILSARRDGEEIESEHTC